MGAYERAVPQDVDFYACRFGLEICMGCLWCEFRAGDNVGKSPLGKIFGGLEVLTMELEANEEEKAALAPLVKRLRDYVFDICNGEVLVAEEDLKESKWTGPLDCGRNMEPKWEDGTFYVVAIVWKVRKAPE